VVDYSRRTYLKGIRVAAGSLAGVVGVNTALGQTSQQEPQPWPKCPIGTTLLAYYEVTDNIFDTFKFRDGDDVVNFEEYTVGSNSGGIVEVEWNTQNPSGDSVVGAVTVGLDDGTADGTTTQEDGGVEGLIDVSDQDVSITDIRYCSPRAGRAVLCELDMDTAGAGAIDTEMHFDGDPGGTGRNGVVHVTSESTSTSDYAHTMANVLTQRDQKVSLGDLTTLTFDYYEGPSNANAMPDEIFLSFLTGTDDLKLAVKHVNADTSAESWQSFNVLNLVENETWKVEDISLSDLRTSEAAKGAALDLRDSPDENVDLQSQYSSARLAGVGIGAGNTRSGTTIDRYFDNLVVVDSNSQSTLEFPAIVPLKENGTRTESGGDDFVVTLEFDSSESGLSLDDVVAQSVSLNKFGAFLPPIESGAVAESIDVSESSLEATFPDAEVDAVLGSDSTFVVTGDFANSSGSSFYSVGTK
jgi:hypothetical protein